MESLALRIAGVVFLVVSILHLVRLILKLPFSMGSIQIPVYVSGFGFAAGLALAIWMFAASAQKK